MNTDTTMTTDTKAAWKRRALRAEAELESLRKIRQTEYADQMQMYQERSRLIVAMGEIEDSLKWAREGSAT